MRFLLNKYRTFWPIALLVLIECGIFFTNYIPNTWLLGWDNIMPELNFKENLIRNLVGVWQEHRGVGLYDGMSHIANTIHTLTLWGLSFLFPLSTLRYIFTLLMHCFGGIGMYILLRKTLPTSQKWIAFVGTILYLFNIGTIQMFYTPLESFSIHFATLPWLAWSATNVLEQQRKRDYYIFFLISLLVSSQFFVTTLFFPTCIVLFATTIPFLFLTPMKSIKTIVLLWTSFLCIQCYWLLPYIVGIFQNAPIIASAKINLMSSPEIVARNNEFGTIANIALLKGYMFQATDLTKNGSVSWLMGPWKNHFSSFYTILGGYLLSIIALFGFFSGIIKKNKHIPAYVFLFCIGLLFLGTDIPGLREMNTIIRTRIPFVGEALRFSFTKFMLLFVFAYSVLFSFGITSITSWVSKGKKWILPSIFAATLTLLGFLAYPIIPGNFFYSELRIHLPTEYIDLFAYMNTQNPHGKIALLPQPDFWSWKYYNFGYRGSGFVWYGLAQPTMDRAFDPWSNVNENYYWELSKALYSKDTNALNQVLTKYDISYILLDENQITAANDRALFIDETKNLLSSMEGVVLTKKFTTLSLYTRINNIHTNTIDILTDIPTVSPTYLWTDVDVAFQTYGTYIATNSKTADITYTKQSLFSKRTPIQIDDTITQQTTFITEATVGGILKKETASPCKPFSLRPTTIEIVQNEYLHFESTNNRICGNFGFPELRHNEGYLIKITSRNVQGKPLTIAFINQTAKHTELEVSLTPETAANTTPSIHDWNTHYLILPPLAFDGKGYSVFLSSDGIGKQQTINDISRIEIYALPYEQLIHTKTTQSIPKPTTNIPLIASHINPALYTMNAPPAVSNATLILNQSYDPGWIAIQTSNGRFTSLTQHVKINSWANGWTLPTRSNDVTNSEEMIIIFFLPQLLEWFGFLLIPIPFLLMIPKKHI